MAYAEDTELCEQTSDKSIDLADNSDQSRLCGELYLPPGGRILGEIVVGNHGNTSRIEKKADAIVG